METKHCKFCNSEHPLTKEWWTRPKQFNRSCKSYIKNKIQATLIIDKTCPNCSLIKSVKDFPKDSGNIDGYKSCCKSCDSLRGKQRRAKNKALGCKPYEKISKEKRKQYQNAVKIKRQNNPVEKYKQNVRNFLNKSFDRIGVKKNQRTEKTLGCTLEEFRSYTESLFIDGMTWQNRGYTGWHYDHIIPLRLAKTIEDVEKLNYYKNLRPLWSKNNYEKSDSVDLSSLSDDLLTIYFSIVGT